jgi:pimeloyl-ACP methyl ester carboxylesterase
METVSYQKEPESRQKTLLVLLRGIGGNHKSFEKHGLIDEVIKRDLPLDIIAPNAHFGYYDNKTVEDRINEDIVLPARDSGYEQIWLAGFSMGGLGSLFYLREYAGNVDGVFLICPFLGWPRIIREIESENGPMEWTETTDDEEDWQRLIWSFIKQYSTDSTSYPPVFMGYGEDDILAGSGDRLFATVLPEDHHFSLPGGHSYSTFRTIFSRHLDRLEEIMNDPSPPTRRNSR